MWREYPIEANFDLQKVLIRTLRTWIKQLEADNVIAGYCFDHYFPDPNELRIRFQYPDETNREDVERQLETQVRALIPNYNVTEGQWGDDIDDRHVLQAYEFGSRCAFLAWELIESGRFPEDYFSNALAGQNQNGLLFRKIPFEFQTHFNHGVMNSLGVLKMPTEQAIHINHLMDSTGCKTKAELIAWLQQNLP